MNVTTTTEVRVTRPVYLGAKGRVHVAVRGIEGVVTASRVKVTRLAKGGYSVRLLGGGQTIEVKGTDYLMVASREGTAWAGYVSALFA